jgi:hypothetical protein
MSSDEALASVLRVSCALSIFGSIAVMTSTSNPGNNKKKIASLLIFWLSFADFCCAVVYLFASFEGDSEKNTWTCQTTAVLGIFFPVASFLWTDFIAIYLYTLIIWGKFRPESTWASLMRWFHIASWGPALLCIILVAAADKAGRSPDSKDNTGGWCWVHASSKGELFLWELIGGKFVEWVSALVILPYCYVMSARRLMSLEEASRIYGGPDKDADAETPMLAEEGGGGFNPIHDLSTGGGGGASGAVLSTSLVSTSAKSPLDQLPRKRTSIARATQQGRVEFKSIYIKLVGLTWICTYFTIANGVFFHNSYTQAVVPVLFILIRLWGSVRAILYFAHPSDTSNGFSDADRWLQYLQAAFDPSQGFFNFLVFVASSREEMTNSYTSARRLLHRALVFFVGISSCLYGSSTGYSPRRIAVPAGEDKGGASGRGEVSESGSETSPFADGHRIHSDSSLSKASMEGGVSQVDSARMPEAENDINRAWSSNGTQSPVLGSLMDYTVLRADENFDAYYGVEEGVE